MCGNGGRTPYGTLAGPHPPARLKCAGSMGQPATHPPVLLVLAAFSRHPPALAWARDRAIESWGPPALESPAFDFDQTPYYRASMGAGLRKRFHSFARLVDPAGLPELKLLTNAWEEEYARAAGHGEPRPLNLDPGYITLGKLVLASTKDFTHRIYLGRGIFAEVTLFYKHRRWQHHDYTFPDYRRPEYHEFFSACREYLHRRLKIGKGVTGVKGTVPFSSDPSGARNWDSPPRVPKIGTVPGQREMKE
jgi:hypothetical protein